MSEVPVEIEHLTNSLKPVKGKSQFGIPPEYIDEEPVRVECYKRLSQLLSLEEVTRYGEELRDRFGPLPEMTALLLELRKIRVLARQLKLVRLTVKDRRLIIETPKGLYKLNGKVPELTGQTGGELVAGTLKFSFGDAGKCQGWQGIGCWYRSLALIVVVYFSDGSSDRSDTLKKTG